MAWDIKVEIEKKSFGIVGELTIFSVLDIRNRLLEVLALLDEVDVDLHEVSEIDTAGLQLMLLAKRKPGKTVRFCKHSDEVMRLIDLANLGQTLGDPLILTAN